MNVEFAPIWIPAWIQWIGLLFGAAFFLLYAMQVLDILGAVDGRLRRNNQWEGRVFGCCHCGKKSVVTNQDGGSFLLSPPPPAGSKA